MNSESSCFVSDKNMLYNIIIGRYLGEAYGGYFYSRLLRSRKKYNYEEVV